MRRILLTGALCALILAVAPQPGTALKQGAHVRSDAADLSAAKKKKKQRHYVHLRQAPQVGYGRRPWMDPSFGPDGRLYPNPYPPNVCSIDEGYGRFSPCTFRD